MFPKAIPEGLQKEARGRAEAASDAPDLFADFEGHYSPCSGGISRGLRWRDGTVGSR